MGIIQRQGIRNSIISYTGIALGAISLLFVQPHFLTKEEIGLTRILFSFSTLLSISMMIGSNNVTIRYFPHFLDRAKGHHGFFGLMLILPCTGFLLVGLILLLLKGYIISKYVEQSKLFTEYFYYIYPMSFFLTFNNVLTSYSYSLLRTSVPALINDVLVRIGSIILFTIYFIKLVSLNQFVFLFVGIYGLQFIALVGYIFVLDRPSFKIDWNFLARQNPLGMLRFAIILSIGSFSGLGLKYLDTVMLGAYKSKTAGLSGLDMVGIYSIAGFVGTIVEAPLNALEKIIIPKIAQAWARNDRKDLQHIYYLSSKYLFLVGGILFVLVNVNLDSLFMFIPDRDFAQGKSVVLIISLGTLINMATGSNDAIIYTSRNYGYITYLLIVVLILAFVSYRILIPILGINGAALVTALSAFLFNMGKYAIIWGKFNLQPFNLTTLKIAAVIAITFAIGSMLPGMKNPLVDVIIKSGAITICFAALVLLLRIVVYRPGQGFDPSE